MAREGKDGRKLIGGREGEIISRNVLDLPLLKKSAADLRAKV